MTQKSKSPLAEVIVAFQKLSGAFTRNLRAGTSTVSYHKTKMRGKPAIQLKMDFKPYADGRWVQVGECEKKAYALEFSLLGVTPDTGIMSQNIKPAGHHMTQNFPLVTATLPLTIASARRLDKARMDLAVKGMAFELSEVFGNAGYRETFSLDKDEFDQTVKKALKKVPAAAKVMAKNG